MRLISVEDGGVIDLPHLLRREQLEPDMLLGLSQQGGLQNGVPYNTEAQRQAEPARL